MSVRKIYLYPDPVLREVNEDVVVFDDEKILSVPRFDDELIRHKILDAIGDLYLLGPIKAHVIAVKTGHAFNSQIAKQIQAYRTKGE